MNKEQIESGLSSVAGLLNSPITIVIAGSAALVLCEEITRGANDCDIADVLPISAEQIVNNAGNKVSGTLNLPADWLNTCCMAWKEDFPAGWQGRLRAYDAFNAFTDLTVRLMSKGDCAAMLLLRLVNINDDWEQTLIDLKQMHLTGDDLEVVRQHLLHLEVAGHEMSQARVVLQIYT